MKTLRKAAEECEYCIIDYLVERNDIEFREKENEIRMKAWYRSQIKAEELQEAMVDILNTKF